MPACERSEAGQYTHTMEKINGTDAAKLQEHLSLLQNEYTKLQARHSELEKQHAITLTALGEGGNSFISRISKSVANLYEQQKYSDMTVRINANLVPAHKFVFLARSHCWGVPDLNEVVELDWSQFHKDVGKLLLKWIYTDELNSDNLESILSLMKVANDFRLSPLVQKCENSLISSVDRSNCVKFYMMAMEISACKLRDHCSELISVYWTDFTKEDFKYMSAEVLQKMLMSMSRFPLHDAIRIEREDVVLKLVEDNNSVLAVNEVDNSNSIPLDIALQSKQERIAKILLGKGANLNAADKNGCLLLHKAILRCDDTSAKFLLDHGADASIRWVKTGETPLHLVCRQSNNLPCAEILLQAGSDINAQDIEGRTPLHICVGTKNEDALKLILKSKLVNLELTTTEGDTALWLALKQADFETRMKNLAQMLVKAGASPNNVCSRTNNSLLHRCAENGNEAAGLFLCQNGANVNLTNMNGETPLHTSCRVGLPSLVSELLTYRADPAVIAIPSRDLAIHIAIKVGHTPCALAILDSLSKSSDPNLEHILSTKDSNGFTPLGVSLSTKNFELAETLVRHGSDVNAVDSDGQTLLNRFIAEKNSEAAIFILNNVTSNTSQTTFHTSSLLLAVEQDLPIVIEALCKKGYDMSVTNKNGDCVLWVALQKESSDIASILVRFGIDTDCWTEGPDGHWTLLHRSILENKEDIACFLIEAGCDVNSPMGIQKGGSDSASPLHLCADLGLVTAASYLLSHGAQVNAKGPDGKTPLHVAIQRQHQNIVTLLLENPTTDLSIRDKSGYAPFAAAMYYKNNKAAQFILSKYPTAAEQYNARGKNYLHESISEVNVENVMFLLSINVDVNSRTKDTKMLSSLHLAVEAKSELLVRNLLLAGANIHERTPHKWTALHIAAEKGDANIVSVLLDNGADITAVDNEHNNALSIAVKHGNYQVCKVLLVESRIDAESVNLKGQNPLHLLAKHSKENAVDILTLFLECMPDYPINKADVDGNTPLLLAYINGNGDLCRALVKNNAALGAMNKDGITIFNYQVPTRQLLYRLLDYLTEEPPWVEGDVCLECGSKFSITVRKHHCRHCGRILCNSCSGKDIPIVKFNINKPVRVCSPCFDVLALGGAMI